MKSLRLSLSKRQRGATLAFSMMTLLRPSLTLCHTMPAARHPCPAFAFSIAQTHPTPSWRCDQEDDCCLQLLHGACSQSQADTAKEEEEIICCTAAETRIPLEGRLFQTIICTANVVGSTLGTGLERQRQSPASSPAFCHLQTPSACMAMHNCIAESLCSAVTGRFSWWPGASTLHVREKSVVVAF